MTHRTLIQSAVIAFFCIAIPLSASADQQKHAQKACKAKITETYGLNKFRNAWVERLGHHKFQVHGDHDARTAVAVGVGLAIVAAIASSSNNDKGGDLSVPKTILEDDCHDILQYRLH